MLPRRIGYDIDIREVRAVTDLAVTEDWEDIYFTVLAGLQDDTPHPEVTSRELKIQRTKKLAYLSSYIALIGLVSAVSVAVAIKRRKVSRQ